MDTKNETPQPLDFTKPLETLQGIPVTYVGKGLAAGHIVVRNNGKEEKCFTVFENGKSWAGEHTPQVRNKVETFTKYRNSYLKHNGSWVNTIIKVKSIRRKNVINNIFLGIEQCDFIDGNLNQPISGTHKIVEEV